jgi:hypothetical protein
MLPAGSLDRRARQTFVASFALRPPPSVDVGSQAVMKEDQSAAAAAVMDPFVDLCDGLQQCLALEVQQANPKPSSVQEEEEEENKNSRTTMTVMTMSKIPTTVFERAAECLCPALLVCCRSAAADDCEIAQTRKRVREMGATERCRRMPPHPLPPCRLPLRVTKEREMELEGDLDVDNDGQAQPCVLDVQVQG